MSRDGVNRTKLHPNRFLMDSNRCLIGATGYRFLIGAMDSNMFLMDSNRFLIDF